MQSFNHALVLIARAADDSSNNNKNRYETECPKPLANLVGTGAPLFGPGTINLHQLMVYVSGPCLFVTMVSCFFLSWRHLHRYTSPQEQRQILRVINLPLAYALFNFLALTFTLDYMFIEPLGAVYEAFAVAALFLLLLEYVCPDGTDRDTFFRELEMKNKDGSVKPGGSLMWYKTTYASVLQYPLLKTVLVIIQIITQYTGDFCESSFSVHHAHLWLTLADYLFVGGALGATIKFSMRFKREYNPAFRARPKVWTFLGILFFQIIQDLIFHLLNGKLFHPTKKATYNDINFGIASFMTCMEAVLFSLLMHWSFSSTQYREGSKMDRFNMAPAQRKSTFRAIIDALNVSDIVAGTVIAMAALVGKIASRASGNRATMDNQATHLEPLSYGRPQVPGRTGYGMRSTRDGMFSPEQQGDYETSYAAGYHAPPMPPQAARDPSPGAMQGRTQTFRADELRPGYYGHSREGSYEESRGMLREEREMV